MSAAPLPVSTGLRWVQPGAEPHHELRDGDDRVLGQLRFLPKAGFTWEFTNPHRAQGAVGSSHWDLSIERKGISGFFGLSGTALVDAGHTGIVKAGPFFTTGTLLLASGRRLQWKGSMFEGRSSIFVDEGGRTLMQFRSGSYFTRVNAYVDVPPESADTSEWPLLALLGLYLRVLMNRPFD